MEQSLIERAQNRDIEAMYALAEKYYWGADDVQLDYAQAFSLYQEIVSLAPDHAEALNRLGKCYARGFGVEADADKALACFERAAENGSSSGVKNLGLAYLCGRGAARDAEKGIALLERAVAMNDGEAMVELGDVYRDGKDAPKDTPRAIALYEQAMALGCASGYTHMALAYGNGDSVEKDEAKSNELWEKAAQLGHIGAQYTVGCHYERGYDCPVDMDKALYWLKKAAAQGDGDAYYELAMIYFKGAEDVAQDDEKCVTNMERARQLGDPDAYAALAVFYSAALSGLEKDEEKASAYFVQAAQMEDECNAPYGLYCLAIAYFNGCGVEKDVPHAARLWEQAARWGHIASIGITGDNYLKGDGVEKDIDKAIEWLSMAAEENQPEALKELADIYLFMDLPAYMNYPLGIDCLKRAADAGNLPSLYNLAFAYNRGNYGLEKDLPKAIDYMRKAADAGMADALYPLGTFYEQNGECARAAEAYQKAVDTGDAYAAYSLGELYREGKGVARDASKAVSLYLQAARGQDDNAVSALLRLAAAYIGGEGTSRNLLKASECLDKAKAINPSAPTEAIQSAIERSAVHVPAGAAASRQDAGDKKKGCYIATFVYGSYDCPEVWLLRRFRDGALMRTAPGRAFIRLYYAVSPRLVKRFGGAKWFARACRPPLDCLTARLKRAGYSDKRYTDQK